MPIQSETQKTFVVPRGDSSPFEAAASGGQSPAEIFKESSGKTPKAPPSESGSDFEGGDLQKARSADSEAKGVKQGATPSEQRQAPEPRAPGDKPKLGDLPKPSEYEPKGREASTHWKELKQRHSSEVENLTRTISQLQGDIKQAREIGTPEEVKGLKDELKQYRDILKDVAIERSPEFRAKYTTRESATMTAAKMAAGQQGERLETLLKTPASKWRDDQIQEITDGLGPSAQREVNAALGVLAQINIERQAEIASSRESFEQNSLLTQRQQQEQLEQVTAQRKSVFDDTLKEWTDPIKGHPFFVERENDTEHNQGVREALAIAEEIYSGQMDPADMAKAAMWAASGERVLKSNQELLRRAEEAEAKVESLRGVEPGLGRSDHQAEEGDIPVTPGSPGHLRGWASGLEAAQQSDRAKKAGRV